MEVLLGCTGSVCPRPHLTVVHQYTGSRLSAVVTRQGILTARERDLSRILGCMYIVYMYYKLNTLCVLTSF